MRRRRAPRPTDWDDVAHCCNFKDRRWLGRPCNEDSPFLLLAAAVVQQARVDQAHRCSSNCKRCGKCGECQRAAISARLFLTALRTSDPAWGGVWLDWLQYAAVRAGVTSRQRDGYGP